MTRFCRAVEGNLGPLPVGVTSQNVAEHHLGGSCRSAAEVEDVLPHLPRLCADKGRVLLDFVHKKRKLCGAVWDVGFAHLLQPREGRKDGAKPLCFTLAESNPMCSKSLVSTPAGAERTELATRSRK